MAIPRDENQTPLISVAAAGEVTPYSGNASSTTGGSDYVFKWGPSGTTQVNHVMVQNRTGADAYYRLDKACTGICTLLQDKTVHFLDVQCTSVHWYTAANQTILGESSTPTTSGLVTSGWL
jgi:hypothetical protein